MANLNKENIITVDVKNATVKTEGSMSFYVTDIKTCNIYCQLVVNEAKSKLVSNYAPVENAEDFSVTLRLIKPNNEPKELSFTMLNQVEAFFYVDLTDEYKDHAGTYKCELFVDCLVNGELERITTSSFTYTVHKSIWSDLDGILNGGNPGQALIEKLATMAYVDDSISAIPETDLLNDFAQVSYVNESIDKYDNKIIRQDFASRQYVNDIFNNIKYDIEEAGYTTESYVDNEIGKLNTGINSLLINNYAPITYVDNAINQLIGSGDDDSFATKLYVNQEVAKLKTDTANNYINKTDYAADKENIYNTLSAYNYGDTIDDMNQRINLIVSKYAPISYVDQKIAEAQLSGDDIDLSNYVTKDSLSSSLSKYATNNFVSSFFNECIDGRLADYATKDYVGDEIRKLSNSMLNFSDIEFYIEDYLWTNEYTTKDYVNEAIANAQIGGGEGGDIDLSAYATKEYVDEAIANIEISGGNNNSILTIGNGSEEHIFSYDDIPDSMIADDPESFTLLTVLLKNVTFNYMDPYNNYEQSSKNYPDNIVTVVAMKQDGAKVVIVAEFSAINGSREMMMFVMSQEGVVLAEQFTDELATTNSIANKADKTHTHDNYVDKSYMQSYVNLYLGDIESLLEEI